MAHSAFDYHFSPHAAFHGNCARSNIRTRAFMGYNFSNVGRFASADLLLLL
jgi:hypothetical protein